MPQYNHMYVVAYTLISSHPEGEDATPEMHRAAINRRMAIMDSEGDQGWEQAIGSPQDSYEMNPRT